MPWSSAPEPGAGLDNNLRTGADRAAADPEPETMPIDHPTSEDRGL